MKLHSAHKDYAKPIKLDMMLGLEGRYQLIAHKVDENGEIISSRIAADWFDNNITDYGLNLIGNPKRTSGNGYIISGCAVGTGNSAESNGDTQLAAGLAATGTVQVSWATVAQTTTAPYYLTSSITFRFGTGSAAGNLSEVGMLGGNTTNVATGTVFSRALIKDGGGSPTTITILSDEILDVTYQLRTYPTSSTGSFNQTINGTTTAFTYSVTPCGMTRTGGTLGSNNWGMGLYQNSTGMAANFYNANFNIEGGGTTAVASAVTTVPAGTNDAWQSVSSATYTDGNFYRDCTFNMPLNNGNFTWQTWVISFDPLGMFQIQMSPTMVKTASMTYSFVCRVSWGRH
jgi:hypothetical protein